MSLISAVVNGTESAFHEGEKILQGRVGKREQMESIGRRAIRSFMPEQHIDFFQQLPFIVLGSADKSNWPWASILSGGGGFISSLNNKTLKIQANALTDDPLAYALKKPNSPLGILGIELNTKRRNRLTGRVSEFDEQGFTLNVDQSFGNCSKYIQNRALTFVRDPQIVNGTTNTQHLTFLDEQAVDMIQTADTFFVASCVQAKKKPKVEGVDVSHRGGRAGFVKVEGNTLTVPDYPGNSFFNTLGNFLINPKGGVTFVNFSSGDVLMLTGTVELLWEKNTELTTFKGAERAWKFTVVKGIRLKDALAFRSTTFEYSPNSLLTGSWADTYEVIAEQAKHHEWRKYKVVKRQMESETIGSFYFQLENGHALLPFEAGQHLAVRITPRNSNKPLMGIYTVSSAPGDNYYRVSVKKEPDGVVSSYFHEQLKVGDVIECKAPQGDFFIDTNQKRPAVLIAGGVGITPMISMAQHVLNQGVLTRKIKPLTIFHAASTTAQRAFFQYFKQLEYASQGVIRYFSIVSQPSTNERETVDYDGVGHITSELLIDKVKNSLALDNADGMVNDENHADFYLCGPNSFMQSMYDLLIELGVSEQYIFAETFGPSALKRVEPTVPFLAKEATKTANIKFTQSLIDVKWLPNHTLLSLVEHHGLSPNFSCRQGFCGSCAVKIKAGKVVYNTQPTAQIAKDEVLICCAMPAKGTTKLEIEL